MEDVFVPVEERVSCELKLDESNKPLVFELLFGNSNPVELEIGIGKGLFMMRCGLFHPDRNFLGIEYARKYLKVGIHRIEKRPIKNVRLIHGEALTFMVDFVVPESLNVIHVYFPDPWPKTRHHKRRLITQAFIEQCHRTLVPGGELLIATDHAEYWEWMCEVLEKQTLLLKTDRLPEPPAEKDGLTNYEIKYVREGRPIYRVGYQKP